MKTRLAYLLIVMLALTAVSAYSQSWQMVWADEFDYTGLPDSVRWSYDVGGGGWGNNELQYYTDARTENARVENGSLIIETHKELFGGRNYTSARLVSREKGDWTYGRVEVRAILPEGVGTWPAIWMLPTDGQYGTGGWPDNGEIDIMEHVGFNQNRVHATVHMNRYNGQIGNHKGSFKTVADASTEFHTYAIEWSPSRIDFSADSVRYFSYLNDNEGWETWPFNQEFHLVMNIAIGGDWGGQQGVDDGIFPQQLVVDYVRVYEYTGQPEVTLTEPTDSLFLSPGATLALSATASDPDGTLDAVTFWQADGVLDQIANEPYELELVNLAEGCYQVSASATDDLGWKTISDPVSIVVGQDCSRAPYLMTYAAIPGTIEAEYYDIGGQNVSYFDLDAANSGAGIRGDEGVDIGLTGDQGPGYYVGWIANREWLEYTVDVQEAGSYRLDARVSSETAAGTFSVSFDGVDKSGAITFDATGDSQNWTIVSSQDFSLDAGHQIMRVSMLGSAFNVNSFSFVETTNTATGPEETIGTFALGQNYPNPFVDETTIEYTVARPGRVEIELYDVTGRLVKALVNQDRGPGVYSIVVSSDDLPAGVYFYKMETESGMEVRSMTSVR